MGRGERAILPVGTPGRAELVAIEGGGQSEEVEVEERREVGRRGERRVDEVWIEGMGRERGEKRLGEKGDWE